MNPEGVIEVGIVDKPLPADSGARFFEVNAHQDVQLIFQAISQPGEPVDGAGIVDDALLGMIPEPTITNTYDTDALAIVRNMQLASRLMRRNDSVSASSISRRIRLILSSRPQKIASPTR